MPKIEYVSKNFREAALSTIRQAETICLEYQARGFNLTLRQLYYQFVARGMIPNRQQEYKRLGDVVNDARLAGLLDWNWLEDRTRNVRELAHWTSPENAIQAIEQQFQTDRWNRQPVRPVVMIEKDAIIGVIEGVCETNDVPYFSCRGYVSQSEMWAMGERLIEYVDAGQRPIIFHLGDHDPSGIDMTRDITDRLTMFLGGDVEVERLALNVEQVRTFNPPPNPAKDTDARFASYIRLYGDECWELDALDPTTLSDLVENAIDSVRDRDLWNEAIDEDREVQRKLGLARRHWPELSVWIDNEGWTGLA